MNIRTWVHKKHWHEQTRGNFCRATFSDEVANVSYDDNSGGGNVDGDATSSGNGNDDGNAHCSGSGILDGNTDNSV